MILKFYILYKNGMQDVIEQAISESNAKEFAKVLSVIETSMRENVDAVITLGDENSKGSYIRLSEVIRLTTEKVEGENA